MKKVKSYLLNLSREEKKEADEKAKELGLTLASYIRLLLNTGMKITLRSGKNESD